MRAVELFAGVGGLAIGQSRVGFRHEAVIEWNNNACETLRANQARGLSPVSSWPSVSAVDVAKFDFSKINDDIDLLSGGVPCQPWSLGGQHKGQEDDRNLFPEVTRVVRLLKPKAIIVENVKGLTRKGFAEYFKYIQRQIKFPEILARRSEDWRAHSKRLGNIESKNATPGLTYELEVGLLNAADFGVPQKRERVFIIAFRSDLGLMPPRLLSTHSEDSLLYEKFVTGEYWARHGLPTRTVPETLQKRVDRMKLVQPAGKPWRTVRDAIADLPDPTSPMAKTVLNHVHVPGARSYPGHTGSPYDEPSKTLKAGVHGVPGGENMLAYGNGRVRYFTVREAARLQTFPDDFVFASSWTESMRQIGNAVPVLLAETVASAVAEKLRKKLGDKKTSQQTSPATA